MPKAVLSIQSSVAYGHVGNAAAAFILQRMGFDVLRLDTVVFSNHPGRGRFRGMVTEEDRLDDLLQGLADQGLLGRAVALLSGYLGSAGNGNVVLNALSLLRRQQQDTFYCCDPVLGDRPKGIYVAAGIPEFVRTRLLPSADLVTPNVFELEVLTGLTVADRREAAAAARSLVRLGCGCVLVTGLEVGDGMETIAVSDTGSWVVRTPLLRLPTSGAGDALTALFLARYLEKPAIPRALTLAVSALHGILAQTAATGSDELALIPGQDRLATPDRLYRAEAAE